MSNIIIKLSFREHARLCALLNCGYEYYWFSSNEEAKRFEEALDKFTAAKPETERRRNENASVKL